MSGRHSGGTSEGLRISALPRTLKLIFKLAPRQLNDQIALAKIEIKRKGIRSASPPPSSPSPWCSSHSW